MAHFLQCLFPYMHRVQRPPEFKNPWASHQPPQPSCSPPFSEKECKASTTKQHNAKKTTQHCVEKTVQHAHSSTTVCPNKLHTHMCTGQYATAQFIVQLNIAEWVSHTPALPHLGVACVGEPLVLLNGRQPSPYILSLPITPPL